MTKKEKIKSYNKIRSEIKEKTFENKDKFFCKGCEQTVRSDFFTLDHVIKRSQSMFWYDKPENLFPLCFNCNILRESKGDNYLKCAHEYVIIKDTLNYIYNRLTLEQRKE